MGEDSVDKGSEFHRDSAYQQDCCAAESRMRLVQLGTDIQETYMNLGRLLFLLDRFAACFWGCHKGDHVIEFLVGRTVSHARAALRLTEFGHYDEAVSLIRNIMEIGNLLWLFFKTPDHLKKWLDLPEKERRKRYSPVEVRRALEEMQAEVPHEQTEYAWTSEVGVHPSPNRSPQSHNTYQVPTSGGVYQERGQVICLCRLAWATASVGGPAAKLATIDGDRAKNIMEASIRIVEGLPNIEDYVEVTGSSEEIKARSQWADENVRGKSKPGE